MGSRPDSPAAFDPKTSEYHLIFMDEDEGLGMHVFPDLLDLAAFMAPRTIRWSDYAIIQGERLKGLPSLTEELAELVAVETGPDSGIEILPPERIRELIEAAQTRQ